MIRLALLSFALALGQGFASDLQENINEATTIIRQFRGRIPDEVLDDAKGVAILSVVKVGFIVSGQGGEGIVVARTSSGWSAPSAIGTGGAGIGLQIGGEGIDLVMILNTQEAVDRFKSGSVSLSGEAGATAGPVGRTFRGQIVPRPAIYTYGSQSGLFAGVSLEGAVIEERSKANRNYYQKPVTAAEILSGQVPVPDGAKELYAALNRHVRSAGLGISAKNILIGSISLLVVVALLGFFVTKQKKSR